jgi:hypothetical protein
MTYSVIVPVLVNFPGLAKLLASIDEPFVPVVVDNWVENRGVAAGWNYGIKKSLEMGIEKFVIMNDDASFQQGSYPSQLVKELDDETAFVMAEVGFAAFATHKTAIDRIGFFDEKFFPAYFEDNDFAYRAKLEGMSYKGIIHCKVEHEGSKTQFWNGTGDEERTVSHDQFRTNRSYYKQKWGGEPGYETFLTPFNE